MSQLSLSDTFIIMTVPFLVKMPADQKNQLEKRRLYKVTAGTCSGRL
jgi:hypothetical protein